jgi:S-methylmethionine-dependent homocysteine/selenocysteine methylase
MNLYRRHLPQLEASAPLFMTEGGLETTLIYDEGLSLPHFAAFDLLKNEAGVDLLRRYYRRFAEMAVASHLGAVFETPTWRASADWGERLGYDAAALADANRRAVQLLVDVRESIPRHGKPIVVSGCIGPRGDGYVPRQLMSVDEARRYHAVQIATFAGTDADLVSVFTMNYVDEAIGTVLAAGDHDMPVVVSFTLETDGRLPSGQPLPEAIEQTDAATRHGAAYFMINCAHPAHFENVVRGEGAWKDRIGGVRANASRRSHAELDTATALDAGDPQALGEDYVRLRHHLPRMKVAGGCCGTDHRHVAAMVQALGRASPDILDPVPRHRIAGADTWPTS